MSYEFIRETFPAARKVYRCIWCGERIGVGEKHRHEISVYDGNLQNMRWHPECYEDAQREMRECGEEEFLPHSAPRPPKLA